jgi:hypothetical protein
MVKNGFKSAFTDRSVMDWFDERFLTVPKYDKQIFCVTFVD